MSIGDWNWRVFLDILCYPILDLMLSRLASTRRTENLLQSLELYLFSLNVPFHLVLLKIVFNIFFNNIYQPAFPP